MIGILQRIQRRHKGKKSALSGRLGRVKRIWKQRYLVLLALPGFIYLIIFKYVPIFGVQIAFKDYMFRRGILGSEWVGLKHFDQLFHDITVVPTVINTLGISILKILICFPLPILFALLLHEVRSNRFKRFVQAASYLPHFISY